MAKVDFVKVEEKLSLALHSMFVKKLIAGESTVSTRAVEFYRMDDGPRPKPIDTVEIGMQELEKEAKEIEMEARLAEEAKLHEALKKAPQKIGTSQLFQEKKSKDKEPIQKEPTQEAAKLVIQTLILSPEKVTTIEDTLVPPTHLFLLNKQLAWFKKKKIKDIYTQLTTTKKEITDLEAKKILTDDDQKRILEILEKSKKLKEELLQKLGVGNDDALIEKERKKHINKRFNVKESWLPLQ